MCQLHVRVVYVCRMCVVFVWGMCVVYVGATCVVWGWYMCGICLRWQQVAAPHTRPWLLSNQGLIDEITRSIVSSHDFASFQVMSVVFGVWCACAMPIP